MKSLSLVIPAYNEEFYIEKTIRKAVNYLRRMGLDFEIIPVSDGSVDATNQILFRMAELFPEVKPIILPENRGKGFAVRTGILAASKDYAVFTDADLSTPIEEIETGMRYLDLYPAFIGSRRHPSSKIILRQPRWREMVGRVINFMIRMRTGLPYLDTQCGFKGFRREVAREVFRHLRTAGFLFDVEILLLLRERGWRVGEMPVVWYNRKGSKVSLWRHGVAIIRELFGAPMYADRGKYFEAQAKVGREVT